MGGCLVTPRNFGFLLADVLTQDFNLAPILKKSTGSTGKSGASLLGKESGGKSKGLGSSSSKSTFGSTSKSSNFGSSASKTSNFGSSVSKSTNLGSTPSKSSAFGSSPSKTSTLAALPQKDSSYARGPTFLVPGAKTSSGLTPSTSRKTYENISYSPKSAKSSTSFGIIWLPGRKRNKTKEITYSSINNDKKSDRTPAMYNFMSGDSPDFLQNKKKEEESAPTLPEKVIGPIATAASAGAVKIMSEVPTDSLANELEEKLLCKEDSKDAAGDGKNIPEKDDSDYLENSDLENKPPNKQTTKPKSSDKVDSALISPPTGMKPPPPQSTASNADNDDCIINCLYYTLQCCDCVLM